MTEAMVQSTVPARSAKIATIAASGFPAAAILGRRTRPARRRRLRRRRRLPALPAPAPASILADMPRTETVMTEARGQSTPHARRARTAMIVAHGSTATLAAHRHHPLIRTRTTISQALCRLREWHRLLGPQAQARASTLACSPRTETVMTAARARSTVPALPARTATTGEHPRHATCFLALADS